MPHTVTRPRPPFLAANDGLRVHQVPAAEDNLVWLVECMATGEVAAVDGPSAVEALAYCDANGLKLTTILNTHTHPDHVGINRDLGRRGLLGGMRVVGFSGRRAEIPGLTEGVDEGSTVMLGAVKGRVMRTEGHIDGHISFLFEDVLFCGDTLFTAGCGYLVDGPPEPMHASLERLAELPADTRVCCAHEYTQDNLRFAWSIEPGNEALAQRIRSTWEARVRGECVVPSTIGLERGTNPFLRTESPEIQASMARAGPGRDLSSSAEVFAATRALKDRKDYRSLNEASLPLG
ncbi:MAG: hydroxyacylglutathione hydrolase [Myxococcota bacterium]|nr:hydroxyacylglutathione hydrolase [Myxococcota bacterium]